MRLTTAATAALGISALGGIRVNRRPARAMKAEWIDPSLLRPEGREIVQDLVVAAHSDAKGKVEQRVAEEMQKLARDMGLPSGMLPGA